MDVPFKCTGLLIMWVSVPVFVGHVCPHAGPEGMLKPE